MSEFLSQEERDQMLFGLYVQTSRIYDLLGLMLKDNPNLQALLDKHADGGLLLAPPALRVEES